MAFRIASRITGIRWREYCRDHGLHVDTLELKANDGMYNIRLLKGYDGIIAGAEPYPAEVLDGLKDSLKIIVRHGIGYDKVDTRHAEQLGICCCNTPGTMSTGVAETALIMMMELSRKFYLRNASLNKGLWDKGESTEQFEGATIGLLGFGNIAQCLARYLLGFTGCTILAYDVRYNEEALKKYNVRKASLEEIARVSDFVSVHLPLLPSTAGIINAEFLAMMKPTACLINTSRGGTVDEPALIQALKDRVIAGAGLDVFAKEPADPDNELLHMDNVFKTPHVATFTDACAQAGFDGVIQCINEYNAGQIPAFAINPGYVNHKAAK